MICIISACTEKDEIYSRPAETIIIKVDHDTTISFFNNQTYILNAETGDSNSIYLWNHQSYKNSPSLIINSPYPSYYEVDIYTDTIHSKYIIQFYYSETFLFYPNSFSPNGDWINDTWFPFGANIDQNDFSLKIYDSKDHLVFKCDKFDYLHKWDGTIEGTPCPVGYYYFISKYKSLNSEKHKDSGMIQLIR